MQHFLQCLQPLDGVSEDSSAVIENPVHITMSTCALPSTLPTHRRFRKPRAAQLPERLLICQQLLYFCCRQRLKVNRGLHTARTRRAGGPVKLSLRWPQGRERA